MKRLWDADPEIIWFYLSMMLLTVIGIGSILYCAHLEYLTSVRACG